VNPSPRRPAQAERRWNTTQDTKAAFITAARAVFTERGFTATSVSDIVEHIDASVGSLYHHFGGKSQLYQALWAGHEDRLQCASRDAVRRASEQGTTDPFDLLLAGAEAFLETSWEDRDLVRLFADHDAPPGFAVLRAEAARTWIGHNLRLLPGDSDEEPRRMLGVLLTNFVGFARYEVASEDDPDEARALIAALMQVLAKLRLLLDQPNGETKGGA
jgi:AcrR family transcriptional regulator